ncbi:MAG: hypothetical protein ABI175_30690, partial [Polyangiales bacterium]
VEQAGSVLATCEQKDQLKTTCRVGARIDRDKGAVRVAVIDVDSKDPDTVGEVLVELDQSSQTAGALTIDLATTGGTGGPWHRLRALWIALATGLAVAVALAFYRRRHAS